MRIGILQVGKVADALAPEYGDYPPIFEELLSPAAPDFTYRRYTVLEGEMPSDPVECDGWLITGSKFGVYDDLPWIEPLKTFLVATRAARRPIVGVCFGHQILAEALGGRAEKSDRGWGIGVHDYEVRRRPGWMGALEPRFSVHAMHQDQVTALPEDATVLAESPFCPYAMVAYGDPERPDAISLQPHPEFTRGFASDLTELRAPGIDPDRVSEARESFCRGVHNTQVAEVFAAYFRAKKEARQAA